MDQSLNLNSLTPAQKGQLMEQMRTEVALASARELLEVDLYVLIPNYCRKCRINASRNVSLSQEQAWTILNRFMHGSLRRCLESSL
ncbi:unnamed protein product [Schistosoma rodhaini]|uniref:Uncharacterized protein n=1 Tax=Schistosoma rodhaini TaxID=6188 RepID=A0AA85GAB5_9TREM|nr:unnamed protein product [Schistosoma rodhaini]